MTKAKKAANVAAQAAAEVRTSPIEEEADVEMIVGTSEPVVETEPIATAVRRLVKQGNRLNSSHFFTS